MKLIIFIPLLTTVTFAQNTNYLDGTECDCDSISIDYRESGNIFSEFPYKNGNINGIMKEYFKSGGIGAEIPYKNGYRNGIEKEYFENGKLAGTATYKNGKLVGYKKCTDGRMGNENLDCLNWFSKFVSNVV